ncbi:MAG: prepilin-type N-terminal cleavage/methylation domain-containing protein [Thiotrichaceae bacterium]|nr:prepilin-type N-terminal cleavage/methylation domain-containing protein [Thiotrichaceae bacterium]
MSHKPARGFTLLELLIVMAIIAMAAAFVIPRLTAGEGLLLKAQVREAIAVLNYARRSAIVEGTARVAVFFDDKQDANAAPNSKSKKPNAPNQWSSRGTTLEWGGKVTDKEQAVYEIIFYPEGGSSGGELVLRFKDQKAKISVNPLNGKITADVLEQGKDDKKS